MQGSIPCEGDYPFVPFCCHPITLLLSNNSLLVVFNNCFNRSNVGSFTEFILVEESCFHHLYIQFTPGLAVRTKSSKTTARKVKM
jgi:hypothetical protein